MKEHVFVSAVIYLHNDEANVRETLKKIDAILYQTYEHYEIILVNDNSKDRTLEYAREAVKSIAGNTTIINLSRKHGIESAMMAGLNKSMGDFVYEFESAIIDFPIETIPLLYKTAVKGFDIVAASSDRASIRSKMFYWLVNKMSYLDLGLSTENIRLVSRRALNAMLNLREKVRYRKALYAYTGFNKTKVIYGQQGDTVIPSKKLNRENIALAVDVIVSFSNLGLKLAHYLSLVFFLFSIGIFGYALYNYFFNRNLVEGWTTLMIVLSTGFAGLFFIIGILGEYISRMLIEVQNRPFYSTKSVEIYTEKSIENLNQAMGEAAAAAAPPEKG